ncbi:exosortase B [Aquabacterium sp.]|uniref:exosortase B n=1 Tax=Aquabacterium sp. TaxID=1872578 RepID=UPI00248854FB|nr:exosortase B [Aquabacterium sp.]MDI1260228.1 exosortase B [Aquabacterium sp.]
MNSLTLAPTADPDRRFWFIAGMGLAALVLPTLWDFLFGEWSSYSQGHEVLLLGAAAWLFYRQANTIAALPDRPADWSPILILALGLTLYAFGRTQQFLRLEILSLYFVLVSVLACFKGWAVLRHIWFVLLFLLFVVPLPFSAIVVVTGPLKEAVSVVASTVLGWAGYPVGHVGVVITVGQYQLLVAEACAGLHSMFILEAMGLLYSNLMNYKSWLRNVLLAVLVVPLSFVANVLRVMILVVVTYHFGDRVGQGFLHNFAGLVLFGLALALIGGADRVLGAVLPERFRR